MSLFSIPTDCVSLTPEQLCAALQTDPVQGLSHAEVTDRRTNFGPNVLVTEPRSQLWKLVIAQFGGVPVRILLIATAVSFVIAVMEGNTAELSQHFFIPLILTLNAIVSACRERTAADAIGALEERFRDTAVVIRAGEIKAVDSGNLVPGDIVKVAAGDRVLVDIRVLFLDTATLRVDESILTGVSGEKNKNSNTIMCTAERFPENLVFGGTAIVHGRATGVVVRTGPAMKISRVAEEQEEVQTPLQREMGIFFALLSKVFSCISLLVFVMNFLRWSHARRGTDTVSGTGRQQRYIQPAVQCLSAVAALAVAASPGGLPAVVTMCLALGSRRMARSRALVRDLPSVDTLGRCSIICSGKTGTLTADTMSVLEVLTINDGNSFGCNAYTLLDTGYEVAAGAVTDAAGNSKSLLLRDAALEMLATTAVLFKNARVAYDASSGTAEKNSEATETALLVMAEKLSPAPQRLHPDAYRREKLGQWRREVTLEFTSHRKSMGVICSPATRRNHNNILFVKGAPEELLNRCTRVMLSSGQVVPLSPHLTSRITAEIDRMSSDSERALRCIGFAFRPVTPSERTKVAALSVPSAFAHVETALTFLGICGILNTPRDGVRESVARCHGGGIRVIVISGENKTTVEAVVRRIGLIPATVGDATAVGLSYTGSEFASMAEAQRREAAHRVVLLSRVDPAHKMELMRLLQARGEIVAMTGSGVHDVPALQCADIGVAMGSGTQVAKAASNMVIADDNFSTVVAAICESRAALRNAKQCVRFLVCNSIGVVASVLATGLLGLPEALTPMQLLWVQVVTCGLPATALGFNGPDSEIMYHAPRRVDEPVVGEWIFLRYLVASTYIGLATVASFVWWFFVNGIPLPELASSATVCVGTDNQSRVCLLTGMPVTARTIALSTLVTIGMLNALNALSENQSLAVVRPTTNVRLLLAIASSFILHLVIMYVPFLARLFGISPLGVDTVTLAAARPWTVVVPSDFTEWRVVLVLSIPVLFIDEAMKHASRRLANQKR